MSEAASATPVVSPDTFVTIEYSIFEEGQTEPVDLGVAGEPETKTTLSYVHGYGLALPAIEKGLEGIAAGNHVQLKADPDDAFGPRAIDGILEIEKEGLRGSDQLKVGEEFLAEGPEGDLIARVLEVRDETIVIDTNHPLAGKKLRFEIDIVEVRAATDEEIADAEEEAEEMMSDDPCGCGHDHSHDAHGSDGHSHAEGEEHDHDHGRPSIHDEATIDGEGLIQLQRKAQLKN